jgi:methanethiol S-methyltransferase
VLTRPGGSFAALAFRWGAAALFLASLAYFLFSYTFTFGEVVRGARSPRDWLTNAGLFTIFGAHHSILARRVVRTAVARIVPAGTERSLYVAAASLLFILVCWLWRPLPGLLWSFESLAAAPFYLLQASGLVLTLRSAAHLDIGELAGLRDSSHTGAVEFRTDGPYGWVRHPIYAGWFLIVFAVPVMTMTRLELATVSGLYILLAIPLEERTLQSTAGAAYARYAAKVRWKLVPGVY